MRLPFYSGMVALAGVAIVVATTKVCTEDNCLRAIQGTAFPTRHGTADCSSYFATTITPATTTITKTATNFISSTAVIYKTATSVVDVVATSSDDIIVTSTVDVGATSSVDIDTTSTLDVTTTSTTTEDVVETDSTTVTATAATPTYTIPYPKNRRNIDNAALAGIREIAARQVTKVPSSIPAYASPCSGSVHYSSACSCVGITAHTITASTPSTTTTITISVSTLAGTRTLTTSTTTATVTDATTFTTIPTGTATLTETTSTADVTIITATIIDTETAATVNPTETDTTTITSSATVTVTPPEATYYQECAPQNLISMVDSSGIIFVFEAYSGTTAPSTSAYDCCVSCITTNGCGAVAFDVFNDICLFFGDGGNCSPDNIVGYFQLEPFSGTDFIIADTSCGYLHNDGAE